MKLSGVGETFSHDRTLRRIDVRVRCAEPDRMSQALTDSEIAARLPDVPRWRRNASAIECVYEFADFPAAVAFVNRVAEAAERAWHHPDIDIRWNKVHLLLTTHDSGGLTAKDFELAAEFDRIAERHPQP
jgi:4a-hydroxytetrahydrobiopterin dehydratase